MAIKKCPNGHQYDPSIYGDNCPFCPSGHTRVNVDNDDGSTRTIDYNPSNQMPNPTVPFDEGMAGGRTVIRNINGSDMNKADGGRKVVALLVSYSSNPAGEVYKVYEGKNIIGRGNECDIPFPNDTNMSREHLLIQYIEAKGAFRATDRGSSNGTYINGEICVLGDIVDLKTNDIIVIGSTKFVFLAIPEF